MKNEVLLALIAKITQERVEALPHFSVARGPRGPRGRDGTDGKNFEFSEHEETIKQWAKEFAIKFEDFSVDQIELLRGPRGRDGTDGKDFEFSEHEEIIKQWAKEFAIKFDDFTAEQIQQIRGPAGKDGIDGKDFSYAEHEETIAELIRGAVDSVQDKLKLQFSDLTEEDISKLRGPRGRDGHDGKNFIFEEHQAYFNSLKPKFSDFTDEEKEQLKLKFQDLTDEEKSLLKLRFQDLTDDDKIKIRGSRGFRGQRGRDGKDGDKGKDGLSIRGLPGVKGERGFAGKDGRDGQDGEDGYDAPYVVDIRVDQFRSDEADFVFEFSDGTEIRTNSVKLPRPNVFVGQGGGGSSSSGGTGGGKEIIAGNNILITDETPTSLTISSIPNNYQGQRVGDGHNVYLSTFQDDANHAILLFRGLVAGDNVTITEDDENITINSSGDGSPGADGLSAYEVAVANGFVGDEAAWLASLVGAPGADGTNGADGADGLSAVEILENVTCTSDVIVGDAVRFDSTETDTFMTDWDAVSLIQSLVDFTGLVAIKAIADSMANSNVVGIVESKSSSTVCTIRFLGITPNIFTGLVMSSDYYLSPTFAGVLTDTKPILSGQVVYRIGVARDGNKFWVSKGDRELIVGPLRTNVNATLTKEIFCAGYGAGPIQITLPIYTREEIVIKNTSSSNLTVVPSSGSGHLIEGGTSLVIASNDSATLYYDGVTDWWIT